MDKNGRNEREAFPIFRNTPNQLPTNEFIAREGKRPPRFYFFEDERRQQATFTEEEARLLQLSATRPDTSPLPALLRRYPTQFPLADSLTDQHQGRVLTGLTRAIRDQLIEPHGFSDRYIQLTLQTRIRYDKNL